MKSSWMKKLTKIFGGIFLLFTVLAFLIPMAIQVDKFRPRIVSEARNYLNGELELGPLSLSLWGQVKIKVDGFAIKDPKGTELVSAKDVYFHVPFSSLLALAPAITLKLDRPKIFVQKDAGGKLNLMKLLKTSASPGTPTAVPTDSPAKSPESPALPAYVLAARLGLTIQQAELEYTDVATQTRSQVHALDFKLQDLSLSRPIQMEAAAVLDTVVGKTLTVKGPLRLQGKVEPKTGADGFESARGEIYLDLDRVAIHSADSFHKTAEMPLNAGMQIAATKSSVSLSAGKIKLGKAEMIFSGEVTGLMSEALRYRMDLKSQALTLASLSPLVPAIQANEAFLKRDPKLEMALTIQNDRVEPIRFAIEAPGNALQIQGRMASFEKPRFHFDVLSKGMDLDELVDFEKRAKVQKEAAGAVQPGAASGKAAASATPADFDKLTEGLGANPLLMATAGDIDVKISKLKAYGVPMSELQGRSTLERLIFKVETMKLGVLDGKVEFQGAVNVQRPRPSYQGNLRVLDLDIQKAVASQMPLFKNTVRGITSFKVELSGESFNPDTAKKNLKGRGKFGIHQAQFATIDVSKMVSESINKTLGQLGEKVPALKGKSLQVPGNIESKYENMISSFTIENGQFIAPDFVATAVKEKGLDLKGYTQVGLVDYALKADWEILDTYNLTKARDLSVEQAGIRVEHILVDGNSPLRLPVKVGGTALAPQYDYGAVPEALGKVALNNIGRAAGDRAKAEASKRLAEEAAKIKAPPQIQNAIKSLFGK